MAWITRNSGLAQCVRGDEYNGKTTKERRLLIAKNTGMRNGNAWTRASVKGGWPKTDYEFLSMPSLASGLRNCGAIKYIGQYQTKAKKCWRL